MNQYLRKILDHQQIEVARLMAAIADDANHPLRNISKLGGNAKKTFSSALKDNGFAVIAEIKRHSPSKGLLAEIRDPAALARQYAEAGAAAISVLTETSLFHGSLEDLQAVKMAMQKHHGAVAILRKDFIIHPIQLAESVLYGADAVLLIASVLQDQLKQYLDLARELGLETLVEVHTQNELALALSAGSEIIGVNHRNLTDFSMDMNLSSELKTYFPATVIRVAESGIRDEEDARLMQERGYDAILVGEQLVKSSDPGSLIKAFRGVL